MHGPQKLINITSSEGNKEKKCDCAGPSEICDVNKDWSHKYKDEEHQGPSLQGQG